MNKALLLTLISVTAFSAQSQPINTFNNHVEMKHILNPNGTGHAGGGTSISASSSTGNATYTPPPPDPKKVCESRKGSSKRASCSSSGYVKSYSWNESRKVCQLITRTIPKRNCR